MLRESARGQLYPLDVRSGRMVLQAWIASRGLIAAVALLLAVREGGSLTEMVSNWDVNHFTNLAEGGYYADPRGILMAFFPALPLILRAGLELGLPIAITGVVVSLLCSAVAAAALIRLGGPWAAIAWLFAPTALFTTVPYTEALFCAAAFWAWERARSDRWLAAALITAVACTVRVSGLFLVVALVVMVMTTRELDWRTRGRRLALLLIPTAVLAGFVMFLYWLTGSWTAWYSAQSTGWVRSMTWPWQSFLHTVDAMKPGAFPDQPVGDGGLPGGDGGDGTRDAGHRLVSCPADVGRGRLGRHPGAGLLGFLLVLLRQSRHVALVPALDDVRRLGHAAAGAARSADRTPLLGDHGFQRQRGLDALVVLAVLHRVLGELIGRRPASADDLH